MRSSRVHLKRHAFSLLEVVVGLVIVALILVPTATFMSDVLSDGATMRARNELIHLAHGKQEEYCHLARVAFKDQKTSGTFASEGQPSVYYEVIATDQASEGGVSKRLLGINTFVWHDANGNRAKEASEPSVALWTAVSRATP